MDKELSSALNEAQILADKTGLRFAIICLNGKLEVTKAQTCIDHNLMSLEIIRPIQSNICKAFRNLEYSSMHYKRRLKDG